MTQIIPASPTPSPTAQTTNEVRFFAMSEQRFLTLNIITFGFYQLYWFYKNWKAIQLQTGEKLMPVVRAIFAVFWAWPLFKQIQAAAAKQGYENKYSAGKIVLVYILLSLAAYPASLPDASGFRPLIVTIVVTVLSAFVLLPIQRAINFHTSKLKGGDIPAERSLGETLIIVFGVIMTTLIIVSYFIPDAIAPDTDSTKTPQTTNTVRDSRN